MLEGLFVSHVNGKPSPARLEPPKKGDGEDVAELEMGDIDLSRYTEDVTITVFGAFGGSDTAVATGFVVIDGSFVVVAAPFPASCGLFIEPPFRIPFKCFTSAEGPEFP